MVSPLWKACADGDLQKAQEFLVEGSAVDIELKDSNGVTPLIEAARNGHIELVKILLEKGADPNNASNQGRADECTSDPAILELLHAAREKAAQNAPPQQPVYGQPGQDQIDKGYYPPPPDAYPYYPSINPALSPLNEGGAYYPPQPPNGDTSPNGLGNLPPPDIARLIPCRYYPTCRYGAQCMFAHPHPQQPFYQGPMPPVPYAPYDPMGNPYMPPYYPSQPGFAPQPGPHPMSPPPPGAPMMHARSPSEVMSPPPVGHFSPNGAPPPPPPGSYGPMSPHVYSHPGQGHMGMQPIPPLAPLPPLHPHAHPGPPHPHANLYNPATSPVPPFPMHQDAPGPYPMPHPTAGVPYPDANGIKPEHVQAENYHNHPNHRDGNNQYRRGAPRRASFSARKPPCLFFPAGKCKNGDDCRFPHVLPENGAPAPHPTFPTVRPGPPRPRGHMNGNHAHVNGNGFQNIEAKLGNMSIRDDQSQQQTTRAKNGTEPSSRSHSSDNGNRPKFQGGKHHANGGANGFHNKKATAPFRHQQRVPNADEFPVLAGSITPPARTAPMNGNGNGLTAAQVLQAAVHQKDGSKESSTRGPSPDLVRPAAAPSTEVQPEATEPAEAPATPAPAPITEQAVPAVATPKPAMSFAAAAANSSNAAPDTSKEVSVSA